jgi:hypothetical protein
MIDSTQSHLKETLLQEITDSNMTFQRKMKVLKLLDQAFRKHFGVIYLSDQELEDNDMMTRSM